jgi:parallel beta-helix repeat protein
MANHKNKKRELHSGRFMAKKIAFWVLLTFLLLGTLFQFIQVQTVESANFVGRAIHIRPDGSIDPSDAPVDVHGLTYTLTGDIQSPRGDFCIYIERDGALLDGYGYTIEAIGTQDQGFLGSGIYIGAVSNVEIWNLTIKGCNFGIEAQSSSKANLHDLTVDGAIQKEDSNEPTGILLLQCDGVTVNQNQLNNNYVGLSIQYSNCTVTNNRVMDNSGAGINLAGSNIEIVSNVIARNDLGMQIDGSNNLIKANDILFNKRTGVFLTGSQNVFAENNIEGHTDVQSGFGIQMSPYDGGNTFYHNDFANNSIQLEGGNLAANSNIWNYDYPQGGNYWDTYRGVDIFSGVHQNQTGSDGIGDTPYQINQANTDRYPLIAPFRSTAVINQIKTLETNNYALLVIVAATIVAVSLAAGFVIYRRRKNKQTSQNNSPNTPKKMVVGSLLTRSILTVLLMVVLNFAVINTDSYGIGAIGIFGGALYFDEILIGFISSLAAVFFTWLIIIKQSHTAQRGEQIMSATIAASIFVAILLAYTTYGWFELFGSLQTSQPTLVFTWTFATTLVGCFLGFFLGETGLKRMNHQKALSNNQNATSIITQIDSATAQEATKCYLELAKKAKVSKQNNPRLLIRTI